jgi:serine/threonine protein phosphatase PrpC
MNKNRWLENNVVLSSTNIGKRSSNDDRLKTFLIQSSENNLIICLIACDGVGGISGGGLCAELLCNEVALKLNQIITIEGRRLFYYRNKEILKNTISSIKLHDARIGASTLVVLVADLNRFRNGYRFITLWAGDSRSHIIDNGLVYHCLTDDHHDNEKNLTSYYKLADDKFHGDVSCRFFSFVKMPLVFGVTTDGVHDKCTESELRFFLIYCLYKSVDSNEMLSEYLNVFLKENISDNLSASFYFMKYKINITKLRNILENKE